MGVTQHTLTRTVYYCKQSYGYARVCYDLPVSGYRFAHRRAWPMRRLLPRSSRWQTTRLFYPSPGGLVHTFNGHCDRRKSLDGIS